MPRKEDWEQDIFDSRRREAWSLTGPNRIVKVVPLAGPRASHLGGFVGLEKYLLGKTPQQIQRALGLPFDALASGCRVYRFKRLPLVTEVDYELTALYPNGLAFNPADVAEELAERESDPSRRPIPIYPPGSRAVHQWRLRADVPVEHLIDLTAGTRYPYLHGQG